MRTKEQSHSLFLGNEFCANLFRETNRLKGKHAENAGANFQQGEISLHQRTLNDYSKQNGAPSTNGGFMVKGIYEGRQSEEYQTVQICFR